MLLKKSILAAVLITCWVSLNYAATSSERSGSATVFLLSLDGIRPDYFERSDTPFLDTFLKSGVFSLEVIPSFPSVTFSSHATIATGAPVADHGVTGNSFYDSETGQRYRYAGDQTLLQAEPIWTTATRQGVRTLVLDWVKSHNQTGPNITAYSGEGYTRGLSDEARIQRVLDTWRADDASIRGAPLRFIMAYAESPDSEGHRFGPDAPEIESRMTELDHFLETAFAEVRQLWERNADPEDILYIILLSDHGMAPVHYHVDPRKVFQPDPRVNVVGGTTMHHLFFDEIENENERKTLIQTTAAAYRKIYPLTVYEKSELPAHWDYRHPTRTGDLVVTVPTPYALFRHRGNEVVQTSQATGRFFGAHGYDPETAPDMTTILLMQRYPEPLEPTDLGRIQLKQVHATVSALLGIEPAERAEPEPFFRP